LITNHRIPADAMLVATAGFERREVGDFVTAADPDQGRLDLAGNTGRVVMLQVSTRLTEKPDLKTVPKAIRDKVNWDGKRNTLTINAPLSENETELLKASVKSASASAAIVEAAETSRTSALEIFQTPAELGERFRIPQLALRVRAADGSEQLRLFVDPEVLDYPWDLSLHDAAPTADDIAA
jgi:type III restriction enzyme